jgi:hypothetical protein
MQAGGGFQAEIRMSKSNNVTNRGHPVNAGKRVGYEMKVMRVTSKISAILSQRIVTVAATYRKLYVCE